MSMQTSHTSLMLWWKKSATQLTEWLSWKKRRKPESCSYLCLLTHPFVLSSPTNMCQPGRVLGCPHSRTTGKSTPDSTPGLELEATRGLELPTSGKNIKGYVVPPILSMPSVTQMVVNGFHRAMFPPCAKGREASPALGKGEAPSSLSQLWSVCGSRFHARPSSSITLWSPSHSFHPGSS